MSQFQENQKIQMEYKILQMENESLKIDLNKYISASQKRRGDGHDSGDFNSFNQTSVDGEGRVTGLLGTLESPFILSDEIKMREERVKKYFRNKMTELQVAKEEVDSKCRHYVKEVSVLASMFLYHNHQLKIVPCWT